MKPTHEQQQVINFHYGRAVVGACAGSGKTATLVNRTKELPKQDTKLIMAFNKKAAIEFEQRLVSAPQTEVRTIHSFCLRQIFRHYEKFGFKIKPSVSTDNQFRKIVLANKAPMEWKNWEDAESFWDRGYFEYAERNFFTDEIVERIKELKESREQDDIIERQSLMALWRYHKFMKDCNLVTFDTMVRIVAENCDKLSKSADHIMIDEYQDVDRFQYLILKTISQLDTKSTVVVGDHNQRIYEWRGALEDAFGQFKSDFPDSTSFYLTKNFRSYDEILQYANDFCSPTMTGAKGPAQNSVVFGDIENLIFGLKDDYSSATILCRYNRQCALWKLRLTRMGLPVFVLGGADFNNLPHVKAAKKLWRVKAKYDDAVESDVWQKIESKKYYRQNEEALQEIRDDLKWILSLSQSDMRIVEDKDQNEREGLKVSTIHKTKGMEFDRVMIYSVTEELKSERCLFYVAATRPRNLLVIN